MTEAEQANETSSSDGQPIAASTAEVDQAITFAEFLESVPPSQTVKVSDLWKEVKIPYQGTELELTKAELLLHCTSEICNGLRVFRYHEGANKFSTTQSGKLLPLYTYLTYICSNCRQTTKMYSLRLRRASMMVRMGKPKPKEGEGVCYKFGEDPPYGPPTPARLIRLFEKERETFLKGRQCENRGLGIGAFVYYRRVVENQKDRILDEIIRVSEKTGAPADVVKVLQRAKKEVQFSKALASVKDAIPQALLINGHNPLTLLHRALSGGLHGQTDNECLALAHDVRVVLVELADRIGQALKDEAELNHAISRLMNPEQAKSSC
jgi:hypothetical protein